MIAVPHLAETQTAAMHTLHATPCVLLCSRALGKDVGAYYSAVELLEKMLVLLLCSRALGKDVGAYYCAVELLEKMLVCITVQ